MKNTDVIPMRQFHRLSDCCFRGAIECKDNVTEMAPAVKRRRFVLLSRVGMSNWRAVIGRLAPTGETNAGTYCFDLVMCHELDGGVRSDTE